MSITRRVFVKNAAMVAVGTAAMPSFLARAAMGASGSPRARRLVVIFQRGAADALNVLIPHGERAYYGARPSIAIARHAVLDLDGRFGLHPAMSALKPLWEARQLAMVHAAGSPDATRSHFDAQDFMESGTPGRKSTEDGWLNRALNENPGQKTSPFRAVAMGETLPRILAGPEPAVAMRSIEEFAVGGRSPAAAPLSNTFESMYEGSVDAVLHGAGEETFEAVKMLRALDPARYAPGRGANYPRGRFGQSLRQLAQLMKADLGVEVGFADIGGWDHHVNEGGSEGQLANLLRQFAQGLAAFYADLGALAEETVIVSMSEFGRTVRENGNRGTDHGHGGVMFVLGGGVRGGKVHGRWPGLEREQLYEGRDLEVTTDFRSVVAEAVRRQIPGADLREVFPGFEAETVGVL